MAKIKWKNKSETERELKEQEALQKQKEQIALAFESTIKEENILDILLGVD